MSDKLFEFVIVGTFVAMWLNLGAMVDHSPRLRYNVWLFRQSCEATKQRPMKN